MVDISGATEPELSWHPLFPPKDDDDEENPPDIQEIIVQRKENGKLYTAPRTFLPTELMSLSQLAGEFGGGEYYLLGRDHLKRMRGRSIHNIPGTSKPMFDDGAVVGQPKSTAASPVNPMAALMTGDGGIMGLIMMMMQQMMQASAQAGERQTQMMIAMMQASSSGSQANVQAMQAQMQAQAERDQRDKQSQIELMLKLTEARGAGNSTGGEESFFKGVEFMRHFATQQVEMMKATAKGDSDFDLEGLLGTVMQALQGFNALQEIKTGLPGVEVASG